MTTSETEAIWEASFPEKPRPNIYTSEEFDEDGFRPLADPLDFITDISKLTAPQLYAQATNNQIALQQTQGEYLELEKLINQLKSRDPTVSSTTKNPQTLPSHSEFEERKEALLYGYKYDSNRPLASYGRWPEVSEQERRDLRSAQDPFTQGGFVPNDRQFKGIMNKATDRRNPDGWKPIEKDGKRLIPRMAPRVNEKEEYWQLSGLLPFAKSATSKPVTRSGTPDLDLSGFGGVDTPINKRLRNTRFNGAKVPLTRDVSEAPSLPLSRASTPKRKRGDTPMVLYDQNGSPAKKPKLIITDGEVLIPPKRKHHNQYTKAKEKAALEALAAQKVTNETDNNMSVPIITTTESPSTIPIIHGSYPWSGLTDQEKRDFHWNNDTLLLAVREDPTWLNEDVKTRQKWTKKILESKYPVRTYSMYKKWDYWRLIGEDKRPRNKKKAKNADFDDDEPEMDEASEIATATPSPLNRSFSVQDLDEEELGRSTTAMSPGPSRLGRGEIMMQDVKDSEDELHNNNSRSSRRTSGSDSASQTISVNREDGPPSNARRRTRASRNTSMQGSFLMH